MKEKKKICVLADDYPSPGRPVFVFVEQLVHALLDLGVEVSIVASQSLTRSFIRHIPLMPQKEIIQNKNGIPYTVYRPYSFSFGNKCKCLDSLFRRYNQTRIDNCLKEINPDILYGHFWHSAYKLKNYAIKNRKPLFVACGEGDSAIEDLVGSLSARQLESFVKSVKGVISVSTDNKRKCIKLGLSKEEEIVVLPNCVDTDYFYPSSNNELKKTLGIKEQDFTIVFVGAFIHRKGSMVLSKAIDKLNDEQIKLIFIGKPYEGDDYSPKCKGIVYKGIVPHNSIADYLHCADVFVLPTLQEGCCNAIVEALACGIPVISSNRPFNDDILGNENSITVNPENVDELADAIRYLKSDKIKYQEIKQHTLSHAGEYSIKSRARKVLDFINVSISDNE